MDPISPHIPTQSEHFPFLVVYEFCDKTLVKQLIMFGLDVYEKLWQKIYLIAALLGQKITATGDSIDFLMSSFCTYRWSVVLGQRDFGIGAHGLRRKANFIP